MKIKLALVLLAIFTLAGPATARNNSSAKRFLITDFGAAGDGQLLNTKAIQTTIDRCAAGGGGTVIVPKGTFLTGAIFLKQGCNLKVELGGVLRGTSEPDDYPQVKTRWEGVEREWTCALVNAVGLTGVEVSGEGTIDGAGEQWVQRMQLGRRPGPPPATQAGPTQEPGSTPRRGRPRLIAFENCHRVRISGLKLHNQAVWCLHILYSDDVVVDGLTIRADHNIPSSDGIDVDSSRRVRITRTDIDVNDDCISIKSGRDADGLRVNRPSEDIVIDHCRFGYGHGGVAMGSETSGGIRNVEVRDCIAEADNWAPVRFKTQPSRGGIVENITYRDFKLVNVRRAFELNMEWRPVGPVVPPATVLAIFRNIRFINVSGSAQEGGLMNGLKDSPIHDVVFKGCTISAQKGLVVEHAHKLDFSGLNLTVKDGPPIIKTDVE